MGVVLVILQVLLALASIALIYVILQQRDKGAGMSAALAGGSDDPFEKHGKASTRDEKMAFYTKVLAIVCVVLIVSALIVSRFV